MGDKLDFTANTEGAATDLNRIAFRIIMKCRKVLHVLCEVFWFGILGHLSPTRLRVGGMRVRIRGWVFVLLWSTAVRFQKAREAFPDDAANSVMDTFLPAFHLPV